MNTKNTWALRSTPELYHYGVKGMRWGVRHDRVSSGRRYNSTRLPHSKNSKRKNKNGLNLDPDIIAMGATLVLEFGAVALLSIYQSGGFRKKYKAKDVKRCNTSKEQDLKLINPTKTSQKTLDYLFSGGNFSKLSLSEQRAFIEDDKAGRFENCTYCTAAATLRRKGYDVEVGSHGSSKPMEKTLDWFKGSQFENLSGKTAKTKGECDPLFYDSMNRIGKDTRENEIKALDKKLGSYGNAYGELIIKYPSGSGHSVEFSVEKGKVRVFDNQSHTSYDSLEKMFGAKAYQTFEPAASMFRRTDNCQPDLDLMLAQGIVKPRGAK